MLIVTSPVVISTLPLLKFMYCARNITNTMTMIAAMSIFPRRALLFI